MKLEFNPSSVDQLKTWEDKIDTGILFEKASTKALKDKYHKKQQDRHSQNKAEEDLPDWFK